MSLQIQRVEYYYASTEDRPGATYQILQILAGAEIDLLAFSAVPTGPSQAQLALFPKDKEQLVQAAPKLGLNLSAPQRAFLVLGKDQLGALSEVHRKLFDARVNVFASSGVTGGDSRFGYLLYVRPEDYERAASVLEL